VAGKKGPKALRGCILDLRLLLFPPSSDVPKIRVWTEKKKGKIWGSVPVGEFSGERKLQKNGDHKRKKNEKTPKRGKKKRVQKAPPRQEKLQRWYHHSIKRPRYHWGKESARARGIFKRRRFQSRKVTKWGSETHFKRTSSI